LRQAPLDPEDLHTRGALECKAGDWRTGLLWIRKALAIAPCEPRFLQSAAIALWCTGEKLAAIAEIDRGLRHAPGHAVLLDYRARFLADIGNRKRALPALARAVSVCGETPPLTRRLAEILGHSGRFSESEQSWRRLVGMQPTRWEHLAGLAGSVSAQGRIAEALEFYRTALAKRGGSAAASALLLSLHYSDSEMPVAIFAAHRSWARRVEPPPTRAPALIRKSRRRLRIGYVSGDFRRHSVAHFFEPLLQHHDPAVVETHCFYNRAQGDAITTRLRSLASHWHDIANQDDDRAADTVRRAKIDILVDLSGHTAHNRLEIFARRPAPVQVTYLGYPDTTGLRSIDYRFTDSLADPPGRTAQFHSETLVRLDPCFLCYRPWLPRTLVAPSPFVVNGYATLACFAIRQKLSPATLETWAEMLKRSRRTRLLLKFRAAGDPAVRQDLASFFQTRGIGRDRLLFAPAVRSMRKHLEYYGAADLMLDPFPYNGTTATCEALWMGAPVLNWCGDTHVSRVGASILSQVGLPELVTPSRRAYIEKALELLEAPQRLQQWRRELRSRMRHSPLMDGPRLARAIEAAYRRFWTG
jgi:protein O-GlcNAc transferase